MSGLWNEFHARKQIFWWKRSLNVTKTTSLPERAELFAQGSQPSECFLLVKGLVKLTHLLPDGREVVMGLRFPGQLIGKHSSLLQVPHRVSASTVVASEICAIPTETFRITIENNSSAALFLIHDQAVDYHQASDRVLSYTLNTAGERLIHLSRQLNCLAGLIWGDQTRHRIRTCFADYELASLIGVSQEHFSRLKKRLKSAGYRIELLD
jgi:CRP-like cAMP-binding protein